MGRATYWGEPGGGYGGTTAGLGGGPLAKAARQQRRHREGGATAVEKRGRGGEDKGINPKLSSLCGYIIFSLIYMRVLARKWA